MKLTLQLVVVVFNAPTKFRDSLFKFTLFLPHTNTVILPPGGSAYESGGSARRLA